MKLKLEIVALVTCLLVKAHAKEYKVDVGRIALIGESAGGHLVSWVGPRAKSDLHKGMPPFLLIHGDKDPTVPFEQSTRFQKQMKVAGNQCDLITIPDGVHGMGGWDKLNSDFRIHR